VFIERRQGGHDSDRFEADTDDALDRSMMYLGPSEQSFGSLTMPLSLSVKILLIDKGEDNVRAGELHMATEVCMFFASRGHRGKSSWLAGYGTKLPQGAFEKRERHT